MDGFKKGDAKGEKAERQKEIIKYDRKQRDGETESDRDRRGLSKLQMLKGIHLGQSYATGQDKMS